ncbi:MAG: NADH-quinone oxidoreductase subunit M, partial [Bacteroidetes bacterium]|nr:NADH-quinone oxidoreductase subunit M [Bacteroidota bacterium]
TVFMGAWENAGQFYHIATIVACASIVVTAVYILRATGQVIMGPLNDNKYSLVNDAGWNEKLAAGLLVAGIVTIGVAPFWLNDLLKPATEIIFQKLATIAK